MHDNISFTTLKRHYLVLHVNFCASDHAHLKQCAVRHRNTLTVVSPSKNYFRHFKRSYNWRGWGRIRVQPKISHEPTFFLTAEGFGFLTHLHVCRQLAYKPLHPTSIGSHLALQTLFQRSSTKSAYFSLFLSFASSIQTSQGTVSYKRPLWLEAAELSSISVLKVVKAMVSGNFSCFSRSTFNSQSCAVVHRPEWVALA